jgi:DNA-binding NarL/FixJ family response regulator
MTKIRILLVDEHNLVRAGLAALINRESDMEVIAELPGIPEACIYAEKNCPDLIIMNISVQIVDGIQATEQVHAKCPDAKVIFHSVQNSKDSLKTALLAGARGYVSKGAVVSDLVQAIRSVASGGIYIDSSLAPSLTSLLREEPEESSTAELKIDPHKDLSERESAVLRLLASGYSTKEIAARLNISIKTVDTYKSRFMEKLHLKSRVEIVHYAMEAGMLETDQ